MEITWKRKASKTAFSNIILDYTNEFRLRKEKSEKVQAKVRETGFSL